MTSTSSTTTLSGGGRLQILIDQTSQNRSGNTSRVRVRGVMINTSGRSYDQSADGVDRRISGQNSWSGTFNFDLSSNQSYTFIDRTFTVEHNSSGNATVSYTVHLGRTLTGTFGSGGSVGTSLALTRIPPDTTPPAPTVRVPGAPNLTSLTHPSDATLRATWTAPAMNGGTLIEYQAQYARNNTFTLDAWHERGFTARTVDITDLQIATQWFVRIRARNQAGWGPWSNTRSWTLGNVPAAPGSVSTSYSPPRRVNLSWVKPGDGGRPILGYDIQYSYNSNLNDFRALTATASATSRAIDLLTTDLGARWYFRIRARNQYGNGPWSGTISRDIPNTPGTVSRPSINFDPPTTVTLSWTAPGTGGSSITGYDIQYSEFASMGSARSLSVTSSTRSRVIELGTADVGKTWYFRVRAKNAVGLGNWSATVSTSAISGPRIRHNGIYYPSVVYVRHNGVWRTAIPYVRHNGVWRTAGG